MEKETITVEITIDKDIKEKAEEVMDTLGVDFNTAVNLFIYQVYYTKSIPFPIKLSSEQRWGM